MAESYILGQLSGNPPTPLPPKSHTWPQCKSYILLPCYKMYEVGTDRENKEQGARRDGGQMMLLHIQQGFILITSGYVFANTKNANAKLKC